MSKLISTVEAAKMLGCDVKWIRRAISCKLIKGWKFGKNYKTTPDCVMIFMEQHNGKDILDVIRRAYESERVEAL